MQDSRKYRMAEPDSKSVFFADYELDEELGRGATSTVFRATKNGKEIALKVMTPTEGSNDIGGGVRFRREAAVMARLNHPNLVKIFEVGEFESRPFVAME